MKKLAICFLLFSQIILAQNKLELSDSQRPLRIQNVVNIDSIKKDVIWNRTKLWTTSKFNNPDVVTVMDDKETGIIKLRYTTDYKINGFDNKFYNDFLIEIKEGKVRVTVTNITAVKDGKSLEAYLLKKDNSFWSSGFLNKFRADIEAKNTVLLSDYTKAIKTSSEF